MKLKLQFLHNQRQFGIPVSMLMSSCTTTQLLLEFIIYLFRLLRFYSLNAGTPTWRWKKNNNTLCLCLCEKLPCQVMFKWRLYSLHVGHAQPRLSNAAFQIFSNTDVRNSKYSVFSLFLIKVTVYTSPTEMLEFVQWLFFLYSKIYKPQREQNLFLIIS